MINKINISIYLAVVLFSCTPSPSKKISDEGFEEFSNKFYTDSLFQMSRILFPLPLKQERDIVINADKVIVKEDTSYWQKKDWIAFKNNPNNLPTNKWEYNLKDSLNNMKVLSIKLKYSELSYILKFKKINSKWFLVYYTEEDL